MDSLTSLDFSVFKRQLEQQLNELLIRAEEAVSLLSKEGETTADPLDRAALDCGREHNLRFRERENRLIGKIKTALEKIDEGIFGICESCGEDIPLARLKARLVTAYCIKCKTRMEDWEKAVGL
jgi:DnaK suppressor protein